MKKILAITIVSVMLVAVMTACSSHSHTESENWVADATEHWKLCDECGEKLKTDAHTLDDNSVCTVCNSVITETDEGASVSTYDEKSNLISSAEYNSDGKLLSEIVYEYEFDADGNITNEKEYVDGRFNCDSEYTVKDGESIIVKSTQYGDDETKFVDEYDENGNITKSVGYDANGSVNLQSISEFAKSSDGEWYEKACTATYNDGTKIESEFNEHESNTSRIVYDSEGNVTSKENWEYTYDDEGNTATVKSYVNDKLSEESIYKTVSSDNETTSYPETVSTYNEDGSKTVRVYDENSEILSETKYDASGNVIK